MFLTELFNETQEIVTELKPDFVRNEIVRQRQAGGHNQAWKFKGSGATASVWEHYSDPTTVVKVVGAGNFQSYETERNVTLAFVHFLVDHGHQSPHFPIVHGINIDDSEVLQVRMENLKEIDDMLGSSQLLTRLYRISEYIRNGSDISQLTLDLWKDLMYADLIEKNSAESLVSAMQLLNRALPVYAKAHNLKDAGLDLHSGNWLLRADGTIVAVDPWYAESDY